MEVHARAPDPLIIDGDIASNWQSWKEDFIIFMNLTGYINKPNEIRANLLKNRIGKVGIDAIQNFSFDNVEDKDDMDILIEKLEKYFNPPKKEVVERYNFFTRAKKKNESIEQYINILKMNKNLLDPTVQQTKLNSKNNDKWNNQADSEVKTKDSMNKTIFPDVPTTNLNYINTTNYSTHLPKNTQYGRTCKDIGCRTDETCVMAEDPCTGYTDKCGRYPTCRRTSDVSCTSMVCGENEYCKSENGAPRCVRKPTGLGYESAGVSYVNGERINSGNNANPYANANAPPMPAIPPYPSSDSEHHRSSSGSNLGYPPYPSNTGTSGHGYPPYPQSTNQAGRQDLGYPPYPTQNRMPTPGQSAYPGYPQNSGYPQAPVNSQYPGYQNYPYQNYPNQQNEMRTRTIPKRQTSYPTATETHGSSDTPKNSDDQSYPARSSGYPSSSGYPGSSYPNSGSLRTSDSSNQPRSGYPSSQSSGYPNSGSGYPSSGSSGYPTGGSSGYPTGGSSSYPTSGSSGYPSSGSSGYPSSGSSGYPSSRSNGSPSHSNSGLSGSPSSQFGYPSSGSSGYPSSGSSNYPSRDSSGYPTGSAYPSRNSGSSGYPDNSRNFNSEETVRRTGASAVNAGYPSNLRTSIYPEGNPPYRGNYPTQNAGYPYNNQRSPYPNQGYSNGYPQNYPQAGYYPEGHYQGQNYMTTTNRPGIRDQLTNFARNMAEKVLTQTILDRITGRHQ
ncbi:hypothetical protein ALC57_18286 [Trachymyrmex cornetzi]|uniref:Uncharacterized protein n=1 Tax=Trachymyrmex cornetzi TaxID=471704 RepID=A0A151ISK1_9HYME|nr:hypothetical protein ALC57_18286 [Trachymyrmex cornetzi]